MKGLKKTKEQKGDFYFIRKINNRLFFLKLEKEMPAYFSFFYLFFMLFLKK